MRLLESQLQQKQKNAAFSVGCTVREKSTMRSNAHMRQFEFQSQQKNVAFSVGYNKNHEQFGQKNHGTREKKIDNQFSQSCKETSGVVYETCEEFSHMLHE